jgi:hypothetical protein
MVCQGLTLGFVGRRGAVGGHGNGKWISRLKRNRYWQQEAVRCRTQLNRSTLKKEPVGSIRQGWQPALAITMHSEVSTKHRKHTKRNRLMTRAIASLDSHFGAGVWWVVQRQSTSVFRVFGVFRGRPTELIRLGRGASRFGVWESEFICFLGDAGDA